MAIDHPVVHRARELARLAHAGQVRKAGSVPYFEHLEAVATILREHGYEDPVVLSAAYLHDLLEDQPEHAARMGVEMPTEVIETVRALTEVKRDARGHKLDKRARFEGYVAHLSEPTEASRRALPISCADKIHNTMSIVRAEAGSGPGLLLSLSTRPGEHAPQLAALRALYAPAVAPSLLAAFDAARDALLETIEAWLPGRAVMIAAGAHLGQRDKGGAPYIEHPLRLMMRARGPDEKIVAVLHDVVEDSDAWTLAALRREGYGERIVRALDALTRRSGEGGDETYEAFIERVARDRLATRVKLLDLADNQDLSRIPSPTERDRARLERYARATERLEAELRKRSLEVRLDDESRARVRARAVHPVLRGDHVTLAHRVEPEALEPAWIPGGGAMGEALALRAVAEHRDDAIQVLRVEVAGSSTRPSDGGVLHVTVSRVEGARSKHANAALAQTEGRPIDLPLRGAVTWSEE